MIGLPALLSISLCAARAFAIWIERITAEFFTLPSALSSLTDVAFCRINNIKHATVQETTKMAVQTASVKLYVLK